MSGPGEAVGREARSVRLGPGRRQRRRGERRRAIAGEGGENKEVER